MNEQLAFPYVPTKLKLLPLKEQPAHRLASSPNACSLAELISVIIGGNEQIEVAERLLGKFGTINRLVQAHPDELASIKGVSTQTALRLKAALTLGRKLLEPEDDRPAIQSPADAANIVMPRMAHQSQEFMLIMVLDTRNRVVDIVELYHGSLNSASVRVGEVFKPAIQMNAAAIVVCHNHPSGDPSPSPDDVNVTRAIVQAGKLMDIQVLDHLVIGNSRYISLKEKGLGFS
jgi:DNA repair protein RadC